MFLRRKKARYDNPRRDESLLSGVQNLKVSALGSVDIQRFKLREADFLWRKCFFEPSTREYLSKKALSERGNKRVQPGTRGPACG